MNDVFNVREQEREALSKLDHQIDSVAAALELAKRASAIKDAPGFQDFVKALDDCIATATNRLISEKMDDASLRELRGTVVGFQRVRALLHNSGSPSTLAQHLERLQNERVELLKRIPKPREKP